MRIVACSSCFKDYGLKIEVMKNGIESSQECPACKSKCGIKITDKDLEQVCYNFFVLGSTHKTDYGSAPIIQFNREQKNSVDISPALNEDMDYISSILGIGFFYYGPRLWMIGEIEPLKKLQEVTTRNDIIKEIINKYPTQQFSSTDVFFRIRKSPKHPSDPSEYDSPPSFLQRTYGRLDSEDVSVLYASTDVDICIHECRFAVGDDIFAASMVPSRELNLLNLSALIEESGTEFESLDLTVYMLFLAGEHSYPIAREIAKSVMQAGYDGIVYPSFFSMIRNGCQPHDTAYGVSLRFLKLNKSYEESKVARNIALFGAPIADGVVQLISINRLSINHVKYGYSFGPII